jgi:hypothetical protein
MFYEIKSKNSNRYYAVIRCEFDLYKKLKIKKLFLKLLRIPMNSLEFYDIRWNYIEYCRIKWNSI